MKIRQIEPAEVISIIESAELPVSDIDPDGSVFLSATFDEKIFGCIGLQEIGTNGLLRSLVVLPEFRGQGLAKKLCDSVVELAKQKQYSNVYLLCTNAEGFFKNYGFSKIDKENAPQEVKSTKQYSEICSDSAVVMKVELINR